ncbi:unnamed protein product [Cuscuta europaea]|uniref:Uncharacterized protein n=1 Tax=Cuscuta europaea TaxID=41803 RepID=A0A9P0ZXQ7_CUSEU|nr:unnamed protein product [Cuscuta europaea]
MQLNYVDIHIQTGNLLRRQAKHLQDLMTFYSSLTVNQVKGEDVVCVVKNSAALTGLLFTLHVSQVLIDLPTLSDKDKEVDQVKGADVVCVVKNSAALTGSLFTLHVSQVLIDLPTLSDKDKEVYRYPRQTAPTSF